MVSRSSPAWVAVRHFAGRLRGLRRPDLWLARRLGRPLSDRWYLAIGHWLYFGYWPDYEHPRSFNEHIHAYMLRCRSPLLQIAADKAATRMYVSRQIGAKYLVPCLGMWERVEDVPLLALRRPCVLKPTVGSGRVMFLREREVLDVPLARKTLQKWLDTDFSQFSREWCYTGLRQRIMAEVLLTDEQGNIPCDYKLYVIGGRIRFIQVDRGRFGEHTRNLYDTRWRLMPERLTLPNHEPDARPACLDEMLDITRRLACGFEFLRVDCYVVGDKLYVGELTNYPGAGFERFIPHQYALTLGSFWGHHSDTATVLASSLEWPDDGQRTHAGRW